MSASPQLELVCPAGSLPALKTAIDNGADCVYLGFKDATNARNFTGLNFDDPQPARRHPLRPRPGRKVLLALNTYPQDGNWSSWTAAVDRAADFGVDAVILADPGLMAYAANGIRGCACISRCRARRPATRRSTIYHERFGIQRAVLPRVLSLAQVESVVANTPVEIEVFGFGGLCVMVEGRCALSAYATGESPNCHGACSPGKLGALGGDPAGMETRLNGILIDRFAEGERTGYPTLCKGRFEVNDETYYAIEEPDQPQHPGAAARAGAGRYSRHQDRGPPAQPGLRRPGHQGVARGHRRVMAAPERFQVPRPGWPNSTRSPRARATPSVPTTGRGNDPASSPPRSLA
jgi:collagenase-like PrtC family protease